MGKSVFIAEKPSVAREFAKTLGIKGKNGDGYIEGENTIVTWCVGHLITMSYPEAYDENLKKWRLDTLPFLPKEWKYEVIDGVRKQFNTVKNILTRDDVETIYICTDSGREGEYIYRLVDMEAGVKGKTRKRVWIDSQTEDEIKRGIKEAKDWSEYDNIAASAYLRAKEDYLMGINFSRVLSIKYGSDVNNYLNTKKYTALSVGRVMTCVLGMIVRREREIRDFKEMPFYKVNNRFLYDEGCEFDTEWKVNEKSKYFNHPDLYKENGFKTEERAKELISLIKENGNEGVVESVERKTEKKAAPLLFNLAELQNECSKLFKISPDETLNVVQELYEKKMVTYPRTDARVLSTAIAGEIDKNIKGLSGLNVLKPYTDYILEKGTYKNIKKTKYTNDKQITDHYAIIPTGQGLGNVATLGVKNPLAIKVYEVIARRFLSIFYPPAQYAKLGIVVSMKNGDNKENFHSNLKVLKEEGYLQVMNYTFTKNKDSKKKQGTSGEGTTGDNSSDNTENETNGCGDTGSTGDSGEMMKLSKIKKNDKLVSKELSIKDGKTSPPKRYNSGSLILAMENAGQLIEDEELREQIKGSGIGTSATRAEILKKLINIKYLALNKKTQIITPTQMGEMVYEVVDMNIRQLLNPELTASWEKGLSYVAEGSITEKEYMEKLEGFVYRRTMAVASAGINYELKKRFDIISGYYKKKGR